MTSEEQIPTHCQFDNCTRDIYSGSYCEQHFSDIVASAVIDDELTEPISKAASPILGSTQMTHPSPLISETGKLFGIIINGYQKIFKIRVEEEEFVYRKRASYFMKTGQSEKAAHLYELLQKSKPQEPSISFALASAYLAQGQYPKAITALRRVLELQPGHRDASFQLGNAFYKEKRFEDAVPLFAELLSAYPHHIGANYKMGMIHLEKGTDDEAIKWFQKAIAILPNFSRLHQALGLCFEKQGQHKKASEYFKKAIELAPAIPYSSPASTRITNLYQAVQRFKRRVVHEIRRSVSVH